MVDEASGKVGDEGAVTDHAVTYSRFMDVMKWGVVAVAILLILMAVFLA